MQQHCADETLLHCKQGQPNIVRAGVCFNTPIASRKSKPAEGVIRSLSDHLISHLPSHKYGFIFLYSFQGFTFHAPNAPGTNRRTQRETCASACMHICNLGDLCDLC